jgi:hypothetical protein
VVVEIATVIATTANRAIELFTESPPRTQDTLINGLASYNNLLTTRQKRGSAILTPVVGLADGKVIDFVMDSELAKKSPSASPASE